MSGTKNSSQPNADSSQRIVVILNPESGTSGEKFQETIENSLKSHGLTYELWPTEPEVGGGKLAARAVKEGATHILACGGDGTVMAVINGVVKAEQGGEPSVVLSIIPGGTANLLATALKIPAETEDAVKVAVEGRDTVIDLGQCDEVYFALGLGLGLTGRMVATTSSREKERWGRLAYAKALLIELGARPHQFTLKLDDARPTRRKGVAVIVANAGEIGGKLRFAPDAKTDDGLLDVCILRRFYFRDVMRILIRSLWGDVRHDRAVTFLQAKRIEIRSDPPLDLQVDGEEVESRAPLVAEVVPAALKVRVPNRK